MERYISELAKALKDYQTKEQIDKYTMALILNELVAMQIRHIFLSNQAMDADQKNSR